VSHRGDLSCALPISKGTFVTSFSQPARSCGRVAHSEKVIAFPQEYSVERAGSTILPAPSKVETVHEIILKPDLSRFCVCFCSEESTPLFSLLGTPRQEPPLLLWCNSGVAPRWPQLRFPNVERRFRDELQPASAVLRQGCPFRKGDRLSTAVHEAEVLQMPFNITLETSRLHKN